MIVLDEQICRAPLQKAIGRWYPGKVAFVTDLRPLVRIAGDHVAASRSIIFEIESEAP
jgi:hypothetical protein